MCCLPIKKKKKKSLFTANAAKPSDTKNYVNKDAWYGFFLSNLIGCSEIRNGFDWLKKLAVWSDTQYHTPLSPWIF